MLSITALDKLFLHQINAAITLRLKMSIGGRAANCEMQMTTEVIIFSCTKLGVVVRLDIAMKTNPILSYAFLF